MARFDNPSHLKVHVIDSNEFYIVGPESDGTMVVYNSNSNYGLGIGDWWDGYQVPEGTTLTICTVGDGYCYLNPENGSVNVWGAGFNQTNSYWYLPPNTIGTLVKVDNENTWIISGASLGID